MFTFYGDPILVTTTLCACAAGPCGMSAARPAPRIPDKTKQESLSAALAELPDAKVDCVGSRRRRRDYEFAMHWHGVSLFVQVAILAAEPRTAVASTTEGELDDGNNYSSGHVN